MMTNKKKDFKLSYEPDGKMNNLKSAGKKMSESANFFNTTLDSE